MKSLNTYINKNNDLFNLSPDRKEKLLRLDNEYGEIVKLLIDGWHPKAVDNMKEEYEKFMDARKKGEKYFPQIKLSGENKYFTNGILPRVINLIYEFRNFNCFLSQFYIEKLNDLKILIELSMDVKSNYLKFIETNCQPPSYELYQQAVKMFNDNPYEDITKTNMNITGEEAAKEMQAYIDKLGYGWKVELDDGLVARMDVKPNRIIKVKPSAKFSEADIEGLKKHEIEGHVGRRYYGLKTGLNLFCSGFANSIILDEGLAVWNSIHKCEHVKPNVKFKIAFKIIIAYYINKLDFCELFDMCKRLDSNIPDFVIFMQLVRFKREFRDCSLKGGNSDEQTYFRGYQMINDMTDSQRTNMLKYNIGPQHIKYLSDIKKFLRVNHFKSLI